jgi:hypothetical protein
MGKAHEGKFPLLPSTTRRGTTLNTSVALDSPSVMSKLLTPPYVDHATTSAESENSQDDLDGASAVFDENGSLGPFLDTTIARAKQIENERSTFSPSGSPEPGEHASDDFDEAYIELDDDLIDECHAAINASAAKILLARRAIKYTPPIDPTFATSPIDIRDKDYDFSLDLSYISIVEKEPFCGTENESAMKHMNELSALSNVFADDNKMRTYFITKIFPFTLKGAAKAWYDSLLPGSIKCPKDLVAAFFQKYFPASAQHVVSSWWNADAMGWLKLCRMGARGFGGGFW